jgi:parallel beta-helix repeat protein
MTLASTTSKSGPYNGNGVTTNFAVNFRYDATTDVDVIVTVTATGVETTKTITTHYTITAPGASGTVTFLTAPASGETVTIVRTMPFVQDTDLTAGGGFSSSTVEDTFDVREMHIQEVAERVSRAPKLRQTTASTTPTFPEPEASAVIAWNAGATDLENKAVADIGSATFPVSSTDNAVPRFDGTGGSSLQNSGVIIDDSNVVTGVSRLGVGGATPDATNVISANLPAVLYNHAGAGVQVKLNKAAAGDTASFLFQTGFSGRAEIGTLADDDFHFKVSPDNFSTSFDAIIIDKDDGSVNIPLGIRGVNETLTGYLDLTEIAEPASPAANVARVRAIDDGAGVTTVGLKDSAGNVVPMSHFLQAGTGAITRTQQAKLRDAVSVFDFIPVAEHAAILSGTSTTDVFSYLNSAMTAGAGGTVLLPEGLYNCSDDVDIPTGTHVIGYGATLKATNGNASNPVLVDISNHAGNVVVEGITFDGNITGLVTAAFNNVVTVFNAERVRFHRCKWQNCKGIAGIWSNNCSYGGATECEVNNCGNYDLISLVDADRKQGLALTGSGVHNMFFINNVFIDVGLDPLAVQGSTDTRVIGNYFNGTRAAVYVSTSTRPIVIGNTFTGSVTPSDLLGGPGLDCANSADVVIQGNISYGNDSAGILLANIDGGIISGNVCKNNQISSAFTPNHLGGICVAVTSGEICRDLVLTGNYCYDDQVTKTQRFAIGVRDDGGEFRNIRIDRTNRLVGYDSSGNESDVDTFQTGDLGYSGRETWRSHIGHGKLSWTTAAGNGSTTISAHGADAPTADGTATGRALGSGNYFARQNRISSVSAASGGANTGHRFDDHKYLNEGARVTMSFGWQTFQTGAAAFIGMRASDAVHGNGDPSAFVSCVGVGIDASQTTWRLLHNDSAGACTATDLGSNFPANTNNADWYELELWWGNSPTHINYRFTRMNAGFSTTGQITSTNIPATSTILNSQIIANTRAGTSALDIAWGRVVSETF